MDTFLDYDHLKKSFPGYDIRLADDAKGNAPPFKLTFIEPDPAADEEKVPSGLLSTCLCGLSLSDCLATVPHELPCCPFMHIRARRRAEPAASSGGWRCIHTYLPIAAHIPTTYPRRTPSHLPQCKVCVVNIPSILLALIYDNDMICDVVVAAIRSAMDYGLTMVVGPPGTGKTDVAVQIISNWYPYLLPFPPPLMRRIPPCPQCAQLAVLVCC